MPSDTKQKVLLIGWDAADWNIITPLIEKGKMPQLKSLMDKGSYGTIETLQPALSPMLWTSIATGKTADKHGVLGFIEADLESGNPRPISVSSRQCKALWDILSEQGFKTNVIAWWPSHPAETINGVSVSNLFIKNNKLESTIHHSVSPNNWEEKLRKQKVYAEDITLQELLPFVPKALSINQDKDKHLHNLAALVANAKSVQNVTKEIIANTEWDFTAVYFDVIDQLCHTFMKFYPPQMAGIPDDYFDLYNRVVDEMYCYHDKMLGELLTLAGSDTTVILLSDHGFYSNHLRPLHLPNDPASPALEHAPFGILCLQGKNIKNNNELKAASLLDITPTILQLFNLPIAQDMDGIVLFDTFNDLNKIIPIETWEIQGKENLTQQKKSNSSWQSTTALFQLMELGYVQRFETNKEQTLKKIINESHYYLGSVFLSNNKYNEAFQLLEPIYTENKSTLRYGFKLATCLQYLDKHQEAFKIIEQLKLNCIREFSFYDVALAIHYTNTQQLTKAIDLFLAIEKHTKHLPEFYTMIGNSYAQLKDWHLAEYYFNAALELQPQYTKALANMSCVLKYQNKETYHYNERLGLLSKKVKSNFINSYEQLHELDFNTNRTIDFRKYQLIIRLFLEQFHKGVKQLK